MCHFGYVSVLIDFGFSIFVSNMCERLKNRGTCWNEMKEMGKIFEGDGVRMTQIINGMSMDSDEMIVIVWSDRILGVKGWNKIDIGVRWALKYI